ncbi:hypothetical protein ZIOFF_070374 [Zingiber officinale]|uniref:RIN4 pathogenic type III effector avirulence factor Avr cleavage site domain-containing protein n=1 Tax=Zingiber officinale TaxID=94328 RepID=A0A8J5EUG7_ZINOF|nr:hypothetical protein ZIOFF_070374 [Zingiber officinale]
MANAGTVPALPFVKYLPPPLPPLLEPLSVHPPLGSAPDAKHFPGYCLFMANRTNLIVEIAGGHVPRFGDWNQNAAYTTNFDTARKEKASGTTILSPYDPERMIELHKPGDLAVEPQYPKEGQHRDKHREFGGRNHELKANDDREEKKCKGRKQRDHRSVGEAGYSPSQSPVVQRRKVTAQQGGTGRQRATALPKFGEWDAADPNLAAGYTVIFNKVKEDKKAAAASTIPAFTPQPVFPPSHRSYHQKDHSFWSWMFPCLHSSLGNRSNEFPNKAVSHPM